ncbi:sigma-70 family RNA polymerase sigma factor [uncultured Prevotella sp.]|uniref:RNA polymerase sigma factor n=1 Tax=uncultured Prevotella sp. TaxID=159272 RepID=UPI002609EC24|nr:sigma-70 family RNA polymerase sigma factor [uncultured Prevotella sp.]
MALNEDIIYKMLASDSTKRKAFNAIVKLYSERLYWKIRYIVLSHEDANDVLQNTFLKAWNNIDTFHNKSKIFTWLCSIAINEALDYLRKNRNNTTVDIAETPSVSKNLLADEYFDGDEAHALLLEAVSKLPDVQRTVFNLKYFDNMKYSEISEILNTSEGALKASYHIAVKKISDYFHLHE